jgi:hypothetical protein
MPASNLPTFTNTNNTTKYFNNYFGPDISVAQNLDNAVLGFFESITGNKESAKVLASAVLYTAITQNIDPMTIVEELRALGRRNQPMTESPTNSVNQQQNPDNYAIPGPMIKQNNFIEVNAYLAMFLNLSRSNTSLLGVTNEPPRSKYVERAILP